MAIYGVNFRGTSGYVVDGANQTFMVYADTYPTTKGALVLGRETSFWQAENRNAGLDPRLAGYGANDAGAQDTVRIDLPHTGSWQVRLAMGDALSARGIWIKIRDNTTDRLSFNTSTSAANRWIDALGTELTETTWPTTNAPATVDFSSGICRILCGDGGSNPGYIAHIEFEEIGGAPAGGGAYHQVIMRTRGYRTW